MTRGRAARLLAFALALAATPAAADPILRLPAVGKKGVLSGTRGEGPWTALLIQVDAIAALGVDAQTVFPEVGVLDGGSTKLAIMRLGFVGAMAERVDYLVRADLADLVNEDQQTEDLSIIPSEIFDDALVWWRAHPAFELVVGRGKVPFTRYRQWDRSELTAAAVPFAIERMAPDRRWGATVLGDLGAMSYAGGAYADTDEIEPRHVVAVGNMLRTVDPSAGGSALLAFHVEWTPRAPIGVDSGLLATPRADPWFDTVKVSAGMGTAVRLRDAGTRVDLALDGNLKWKRLSAAAETVLAVESDVIEWAVAIEAGAMPNDVSLVFVRAEIENCFDRVDDPACRDGFHSSDGRGDALWTVGGGATWFVTKDRRSKATFVGWLRRDDDGDVDGDGAIVQLQTAL